MNSMTLFEDDPEYKARLEEPYELPKVTLKEIHEAVPKELYKRNTLKGIACQWALRDVLFCASFYQVAKYIDPFADALRVMNVNPWAVYAIKWSLWSMYWFFQGLVGGAFFCTGNDAGHGPLSDYQPINHTIGFIAHTLLLTPYYSWRHSHHLHHKAIGSKERDENYLPKTRNEPNMASQESMKKADYEEIFGETPVYTLLRVVIMQLLGSQLYNTLGRPLNPPGTNHWFPSPTLFKRSDRGPIIITNIGLSIWLAFLGVWTYNTSLAIFIKYYFIPYLLTNHWIVMITYLQHTDPTIPHFRKDTWTFPRGASTTVDRPLLGWMGRFFLHVSHDHFAYHFFSLIPSYNGPELSKHVRKALGENYNSDSTNAWRALYRSFTNCEFVEDDGDIVMWKNRDGMAVRKLAGEVKEE